MTRVAGVMAAIAVLAVMPGTSGAAASRHDTVTGAARNTFPGGGPNKLVVDAVSGPTGTNPGGIVEARGDLDGAGPMEPFHFKGKVTCLRVVGHRAAIKYRFDVAEGGGAPLKGGGVQVFIEDNGKSKSGPVDRNAFDPPQPMGAFQAAQSQCDDPTVRPDYDPVDSGDYVVRDVSARLGR